MANPLAAMYYRHKESAMCADPEIQIMNDAGMVT